MKNRRDEHPELFGVESSNNENTKSLLDALYEEDIIPTYSFPKMLLVPILQMKMAEYAMKKVEALMLRLGNMHQDERLLLINRLTK